MSSYPGPGFNHTPAYQTSGLPFALTGTATTSPPFHVTFPYVTKFITIKAGAAGTMHLGFTASEAAAASTHHYSFANNEVLTMEVRVKEIYLGGSGDFHIVAGLTGIPTASMPTLTGSYAWDASDPYHTGSNAYASVLVYEGV